MSSSINNVISADWQLSIAQPDALVQELRDITQCIEIILKTVPGSDPLRPEFGTRYLDHIDKPAPVAAPLMVNEIITAIERWETRVTILAVNYKIEGSNIIYEISWSSAYGNGINILPL